MSEHPVKKNPVEDYEHRVVLAKAAYNKALTNSQAAEDSLELYESALMKAENELGNVYQNVADENRNLARKELPTDKGYYLDAVGDLWTIPWDGHKMQFMVVENNDANLPEDYSPFSRIVIEDGEWGPATKARYAEMLKKRGEHSDTTVKSAFDAFQKTMATHSIGFDRAQAYLKHMADLDEAIDNSEPN
jgi:hypothetical protein